jgi:hypothetical protein
MPKSLSHGILFLGASLSGIPASGSVDFERDVQPFFADHCLECHGPDKAKGGLALTTRKAALKTLESGASGIIPGRPEQSEMLSRMTSTNDDEVMPPPSKSKRPNVQQIEKIKRWIAEGAEWAEHWAYRPVVRPKTSANDASRQVDEIVRRRLDEAAIAPSPEATKNTLLKRVYYDLLGLPPTPEESALYLNDAGPDAYANLVERALASPHFGERWGRHWLDQARYADSDGYEKDSARPDAWRYRDWVIESINNDTPLDRFTIEQLAGDLLDKPSPEQLLATAFHRQTLTNREGGVDQEQYRVEAVFDRTETTGSVWLAHTVGCARCHTHKYDQISQKEYYQLFSFFNSADETTAKVGTSKSALELYEEKNTEHMIRISALREAYNRARIPLAARLTHWEADMQQRLAALAGKSAQIVPLKADSAKSAANTVLTPREDGSILASGAKSPTDTYTITVTLPAGIIGGFRLEVLPDESLPLKGPGLHKNGNFVLTDFSVEDAVSGKPTRLPLHSPKASYSQADFTPEAAIDSNTQTGWAIAGGTGKAQHIQFQLIRPLVLTSPRNVTIKLGQESQKAANHLLGHFRLNALLGETQESLLKPELKRLVDTGSDKWTSEQKESIVDWLVYFDAEAEAARNALSNAENSGPKPPVMEVRVLAQRSSARDTRILHRGEFLSPTESVNPGTPAILPPVQARKGGTPDRLDLARWLMSPQNPLPARVLANQIWMRLFGEGIVRSVADFGVRGEAPSHPELLDLLACLLRERGWSRKELIRIILNSATYRQSSASRTDLRDTDPLNRLLARQNRLRVEGEIVRDLHLAAAGLLSPKIGGPSVFPPMPPEIASLSYAGNFRWTESTGEDRHRRGMYTFFKRTAPYPDLTTFDCPDANVTNVRRTLSNTPLQALTTLNAQTFTEASLALAKKVASPQKSETGSDEVQGDETRLHKLFEACLLRPPEKSETRPLLGLLHSARENFGTNPESAQKLGGSPEVAAWTTVVRVILNTDEFITRD